MIKDSNKAMRYTMTNDELYKVYKKLEDFVADCTTQEYLENKSSIDAVFSLIHKHQQRASSYTSKSLYISTQNK